MICDECETVAHCLKNGCVPKHQALDRMAENARELGLMPLRGGDYESAPVHFAWMRYEADCAGEPMLVLARSTEENAFKVYKEPPAQPAPVHDCFWKREGYKECPAVPVQQSRSDVEPVAWMSASRFEELQKGFTVMTTLTKQRAFEDDVAIHTTPPNVATPLATQRPWFELTDEEIKTVIAKIDPNEHYLPNALRQLSLAIEAKLKEKNSD